jgi:hypothetical protein
LDPARLVTREVGLEEGAIALAEMGTGSASSAGITIIKPGI